MTLHLAWRGTTSLNVFTTLPAFTSRKVFGGILFFKVIIPDHRIPLQCRFMGPRGLRGCRGPFLKKTLQVRGGGVVLRDKKRNIITRTTSVNV